MFLPRNYQAMNYSLSAGYLGITKGIQLTINKPTWTQYLEILAQQTLDRKTHYVDMAPALQLIFNSNAKLNIGYRFQANRQHEPDGEQQLVNKFLNRPSECVEEKIILTISFSSIKPERTTNRYISWDCWQDWTAGNIQFYIITGIIGKPPSIPCCGALPSFLQRHTFRKSAYPFTKGYGIPGDCIYPVRCCTKAIPFSTEIVSCFHIIRKQRLHGKAGN